MAHRYHLFLFMVLFFRQVATCQDFTIKKTFRWATSPTTFFSPEEQRMVTYWDFKGASFDFSQSKLPFSITRFPLPGNGTYTVKIIRAEYENFESNFRSNHESLSEIINFITNTHEERHRYFGNLTFVPIIKTSSGDYQRVKTIELGIYFTPASDIGFRGDHTYTSVLTDGDIYKIAVTKNGIYKLDYDFLSNQLGIDLSTINPKHIRLYGNGGGMLPESNSAFRYDDLEENKILVAGEEDGKFDQEDYILFYGEGSGKRIYDDNDKIFHYQQNLYSTKNYYFLKISGENGMRITNSPSINSAYNVTNFDSYQRIEDEKYNILKKELTPSGKLWVGDHFHFTTTYNYDNRISFPNHLSSFPVAVNARFVGRCSTSGSKFKLTIGDRTFTSPTLSTYSVAGHRFGSASTISTKTTISNPNKITLEYLNAGNPNNEAWLDYIELNAKRALTMTGYQMSFRNIDLLDSLITTAHFTITGMNTHTSIWDISDPLKPTIQDGTLNNNIFEFGCNTETLKEFIAFNTTDGLLQAEAIGKISNQNYHGIDNVDLVIVYHPVFRDQATKLAEHKQDFSGLTVELVDVLKLYNEFSSGKQDVGAIRDFAKMLYDRSDRFKYLILFGDGSYDYKNIDGGGNNYIPVFETAESFNTIRSFPTDDFYALLGDSEGSDLKGALDIAVGRIIANNPSEAEIAVNKIIRYESDPATLGNWRNNSIFVGDNDDGAGHTKDADFIGNRMNDSLPAINVNKIFIDAYPIVVIPAGTRVPQATQDITRYIEKGALTISYMGHGGPKGWAHERVLDIPDIKSWTNKYKLPLFVTATCSFSGYDDPDKLTAGEQVFTKSNGGGIALFTTVRPVYKSDNRRLSTAVFDEITSKRNLEIGEILRNAKNKNSSDTLNINARKFTLLGDPSLKLAIPKYEVVTTSINDIAIDSSISTGDSIALTIKALEKVTIEGDVMNNGTVMTDFSGIVYPTIYDKSVTYQTLGQYVENNRTNAPVVSYKLRKNIIFKGKSTVTNGHFKFSFIVPKDINYVGEGQGKISYYAKDDNLNDASGYTFGFRISGTDTTAQTDDLPPTVEVFMNDESFVSGGTTGSNPTLLVKLEDDNGINVVGNSIGHDIVGILDDDDAHPLLLNDYYESALDDFTKGKISFPLKGLSPGKHKIEITAWDIANNSQTGFTEFVVAPQKGTMLQHVLNYPNPFTAKTCFQFEHNREGNEAEVLVQIYTISGILVKSISEKIILTSNRLDGDNCISWDGRDEYGDKLAKGVYLYKIFLKTGSDTQKDIAISDFKKLVILN